MKRFEELTLPNMTDKSNSAMYVQLGILTVLRENPSGEMPNPHAIQRNLSKSTTSQTALHAQFVNPKHQFKDRRHSQDRQYNDQMRFPLVYALQ